MVALGAGKGGKRDLKIANTDLAQPPEDDVGKGRNSLPGEPGEGARKTAEEVNKEPRQPELEALPGGWRGVLGGVLGLASQDSQCTGSLGQPESWIA
jgi:hypothetical protein